MHGWTRAVKELRLKLKLQTATESNVLHPSVNARLQLYLCGQKGDKGDVGGGCEVCVKGEKGRRGKRGKLGPAGPHGPQGTPGIVGEIGLPGFRVSRSSTHRPDRVSLRR